MKVDNYYQALGLPNYAQIDQIKKAFRQVIRECHPDKQNKEFNMMGEHKNSAEYDRTCLVLEAYKHLSCIQSKEKYDNELKDQLLSSSQSFERYHQQTHLDLASYHSFTEEIITIVCEQCWGETVLEVETLNMIKIHSKAQYFTGCAHCGMSIQLLDQ